MQRRTIRGRPALLLSNDINVISDAKFPALQLLILQEARCNESTARMMKFRASRLNETTVLSSFLTILYHSNTQTLTTRWVYALRHVETRR